MKREERGIKAYYFVLGSGSSAPKVWTSEHDIFTVLI
jgi:hypothetical protein